MINLLFGAGATSFILLVCIVSFIADFDNIVKMSIGLFLTTSLFGVVSLLYTFT